MFATLNAIIKILFFCQFWLKLFTLSQSYHFRFTFHTVCKLLLKFDWNRANDVSSLQRGRATSCFSPHSTHKNDKLVSFNQIFSFARQTVYLARHVPPVGFIAFIMVIETLRNLIIKCPR